MLIIDGPQARRVRALLDHMWSEPDPDAPSSSNEEKCMAHCLLLVEFSNALEVEIDEWCDAEWMNTGPAMEAA